MSGIAVVAAVVGISLASGFLGSLVGLGGGIVVVPALTLLLGVDIRSAIAASVIAVIATSSGAAAAYTRDRLSNLRVAMFLEVATVAGAITGAVVTGLVPSGALSTVFAGVMVIAAVSMFRRRQESATVPPSRAADALRLHGSYPDRRTGTEVSYRVARPAAGFGLMYVAGAASGLLGIGGGVFKVPALDLAMRLPIKVSTATSNLMIGVTAAGAGFVYLARGDVDPLLAGPVALGVLAGAALGARVMPHLHGQWVRLLFVAVLLVTAAQLVVG